MSAPINDGGAAFPFLPFSHSGLSRDLASSKGMTLRDWFAGQALAAMLLPHDYSKGPCNAAAAERAYALADAMISTRTKGGQ